MRTSGTHVLSLGLALVPLLLSGVAACSSSAQQAPATPSAGGAALCVNAPLARFAGRPGTSETGAEILAASGARELRWVPDGTMVTMDFRAERVTVHLDRANRVERAVCG